MEKDWLIKEFEKLNELVEDRKYWILDQLYDTTLTGIANYLGKDVGDLLWVNIFLNHPTAMNQVMIFALSEYTKDDIEELIEENKSDLSESEQDSIRTELIGKQRSIRVLLPIELVETGDADSIVNYLTEIEELKQLSKQEENVESNKTSSSDVDNIHRGNFDLSLLTEEQMDNLKLINSTDILTKKH